MASNGEVSVGSGMKLSELFDSVWSDYEFIETTSDASNSDTYQTRVKEAVKKGETAVHMINELDLFSKNEQIEEITTNEIKYLLLPGLLGYFMNKTTNQDLRFNDVKQSQIYFIDFIRLCKLYGITNVELPKPYSSSDADKDVDHRQMPKPAINIDEESRKRQLKIDRFKNKKELEKNLDKFKSSLVKNKNVDDETKRNYYLNLLKKWINDAFDSLESIEMEISILEHMSKMKKDEKNNQPIKADDASNVKDKHGRKVFRPFIITKDIIQKQVFGLGYPGVPTFTVDEFYQQRVDEGIFPVDGTKPKTITEDSERESREKEKETKKKEDEEEKDDKNALQKARDWDDWKDDHRRGWGNTKNKG